MRKAEDDSLNALLIEKIQSKDDPLVDWLATSTMQYIGIALPIIFGIPRVHCMLKDATPGPTAIAIHVAVSLVIAAYVLGVVWLVQGAHRVLSRMDAIVERDKRRAADAAAPEKTIDDSVVESHVLWLHGDLKWWMGCYLGALCAYAALVAALLFWAHPLVVWHLGLYALVLIALLYAFIVADAVTGTTYYAETEAQKEELRKEDEAVEYVMMRVRHEKDHRRRCDIRSRLKAAGGCRYTVAHQLVSDMWVKKRR